MIASSRLVGSVALAVVLLPACQGREQRDASPPDPTPPAVIEPNQLHEGYASFGFEVSAFTPLASDERWWVVGEAPYQDLRDRYGELTSNPYAEIYVEIRGDVSEPGRHGHLGAYTRTIRVTEVVTVRASRHGDGS